MKLKNINLTFFILAVLLISSLSFFVVANENSVNSKNIFIDSDQDGLSDSEEKSYGTNPRKADTDGDGYSDGAEVSAGYNPLKKAPGDKLTPDELIIPKSTTASKNSSEDENLTEKFSQEISNMLSDPEKENITTEDIQEMLNPLIEVENEMPEISRDEIIIKKQDYSNLSKEKAQEKMKKDAADYSVAVLYILASNSPEPLTSSNDISKVMDKTVEKLISAFEVGDPSRLADLSFSGEKALEQLKEIEVPEDMIEIQIKAIQYATYAKNLQGLIKKDPKDPIENLVNYSKIQSFLESFLGFFNEMEQKFDEYGIEYEDIQDKIEERGINLSLD